MELNITKIYLVTNCYGDPNKVYIGKTKNCRKNPHIKTFGSQITYDYIDEVNSFNKNDWKPLECFWIEQFKVWGFEVLNINEGGGGPSFWTNDMKNNIIRNQKIKYAKIGCKHTILTKYNISKALKGKPKPINFGLKLKKPNKVKKNLKPIIQYDLNMNLIKEWSSGTEVSKLLGINKGNISSVLKGKQKTSKGFIFKYK